jgi:putative oxidoreductase
MSKVQTVARVILGLIYFVFGLMGLAMAVGLMKMPEPSMPEAAMGFMNGMSGTGYFIPVLKVTETTCGLLLISGFAAPLALVILAPVTLHILLFHSFLTPGVNNLILPLIMVTAHILAMLGYGNLYRPLFARRKT